MKNGQSPLVLSCLAVFGMLVWGCAPAAVPAPTPKTESAPAQPAAPTPKPGITPAASPAAPVATPKTAADQPKYGGILTVSASADPAHFDIHQEGSRAILDVAASAYDNLVEYDLRTGNIVGVLAERWEMSPDGTVYTFYLREGVRFHDGKPLSSEDVRHSMERQMNPPKGIRSARQEQFEFVVTTETPDEKTVKIVMKQPYVAFMAQFAIDWFVIYPKHIVEAKGDMKRDVLGTGAFKFKSYTSGVSVEVVRNPDYFMKGLPYLDGVAHYIIKDGATRFSALRTGQVKMTGRFAPLTPSEAQKLKAEYPHVAVWRFPAFQSPSHPINVTNPPFSDVRVRRALSLAYDRQAAIRLLLGEGAARIGTFLPPGPWGLPEEEVAKLPGYRQPKDADRAEARRLLAEAAYPDGFTMNLLARALREDQQAAEYLRDQLATIGIKANIQVLETTVYNTHVRSGNFQIGSQGNAWRVNDPDDLSRKLLTGAAQNYSMWSVKKFDDLFFEQARTLDVAKRKAMVRELDGILLQEWPILWPYWADNFLASWLEVKNFSAPPSLAAATRNRDIWLAK
ncbi:MAG: ABC transporter substrate-binding protein [Chloroflexi bacterium]|nr:ABC transporter substrate-binding protein [Chloroflexota bacterium]